MISEALLKEVIKKEISITSFIDSSRKIYNIGDDVIIPTTYGSNYYNIYELAHKCKEWANAKGYVINIRMYATDMVITTLHENNDTLSFIRKFKGETEFISIFKACEWILSHDK